MSIECMNRVWKYSQATLGARLVVLALADYAHDDGANAFPSLDTLQQKTLMSRRAVQDALRRLEALGEIRPCGKLSSGTVIYRVLALGGGADSAPVQKTTRGVQKTTSRGADSAPNPSVNRQGTADTSERARAKPDSPPEDFPDELRPHARIVMKVLREVAVQHGAHEVKPLALGRMMMGRPRKPFVQAAYDFATWAADPPRPIKDVVASYRRWLDNTRDLAATERLQGDAPANGSAPSGRRGKVEAKAARAEADRAAIERVMNRAKGGAGNA